MNQPGTSDDLARIKKAARSRAGQVRDRLHRQAGTEAGLQLVRHGIAALGPPDNRIVSLFHSFGTEIDVFPLMRALAREGWRICLPVVVALGKPLIFRAWQPGQPTIAGRWDIPIPAEEAPVVEPDILLVPLLAFDRHGYRLGYGGGFYDRTLECLRARRRVMAIGVAYAGQEIEEVVRDIHDQPLDAVLTETGLIDPAGTLASRTADEQEGGCA